ncbi:MAG: hypothetical protein M1830_007968 [Pleopsidium flavum]|nr:MAG: hypothetical protein M1830_007968 [Pleopsidium flavum]
MSNNVPVIMSKEELDNAIDQTITRALAAQQSGLSGPQGPQEPPGQNGNNGEGNEGNHTGFQPKDVSFLNSSLELDSIEIKKDKQLYHNVFSFIN